MSIWPSKWRITECHGAETVEEIRQKLESYDPATKVKDVKMAHYSETEMWATATFEGEPRDDMQEEFGMDDEFTGITPLSDGKEANVDIVVVPGLATHPLGSFRSKKTGKIWLRDWLPSDVSQAQLLLYGYDTALFRSSSRSWIKDLARTLLQTLILFRKENAVHQRPVIFIGHSLGGLLVKEALALALDNSRLSAADRGNHDIFTSTSAIILFGVPNLGLRANKLAAAVNGRPDQVLIRDIEVDSDSEPTPFLKELGQRFRNCFEHQKLAFEVISYFERHLSPTLQQAEDGSWSRNGPEELLVTEDSVCRIGIENNTHQEHPLQADHSGITLATRQTIAAPDLGGGKE